MTPPVTRSQTNLKASLTKNNMESNKTVNFNIQNYKGDTEFLDLFISQIKEIKEINKWEDPVAILYLKSKLEGPALKWMATSPSCLNIKTLDELCEKLKAFFGSETTPATNLLSFQNISLMPGETIKNLAHRIETLCSKTYTQVSDDKTKNQIQSFQLLNALPMSIKQKLIHEDTTDFATLVDKANKIVLTEQSLKMFESNMLVEQTMPKPENQQMNEVINKIQDLSLKLDQSQKCQFCNESHKLDMCPKFKEVLQPKNESSNPIVAHIDANRSNHSRNQNNVLTCLFCHKVGHPMSRCRFYLNSSNQTPQFYAPFVPNSNRFPTYYPRNNFSNTRPRFNHTVNVRNQSLNTNQQTYPVVTPVNSYQTIRYPSNSRFRGNLNSYRGR